MLKALASLLWIRKPHSCLTCAFIYSAQKKPQRQPDPPPSKAVWEMDALRLQPAPWKCCPVPSGLATFSFLSLLFSPEKYWQILFSPFHYIFSDILLWGIYSKDSRCPALHGKVGNILDCWTVTVVGRVGGSWWWQCGRHLRHLMLSAQHPFLFLQLRVC